METQNIIRIHSNKQANYMKRGSYNTKQSLQIEMFSKKLGYVVSQNKKILLSKKHNFLCTNFITLGATTAKVINSITFAMVALQLSLYKGDCWQTNHNDSHCKTYNFYKFCKADKLIKKLVLVVL